MNAALKAGAGVTPALHCSGSTVSAIYWFFNLEGSIVDGTFEPIGSLSSSSFDGLILKVITQMPLRVTLVPALRRDCRTLLSLNRRCSCYASLDATARSLGSIKLLM